MAERDIEFAIRELTAHLARMREQIERIQRLSAYDEQSETASDLLKKMRVIADRVASHVDLLRRAVQRN